MAKSVRVDDDDDAGFVHVLSWDGLPVDLPRGLLLLSWSWILRFRKEANNSSPSWFAFSVVEAYLESPDAELGRKLIGMLVLQLLFLVLKSVWPQKLLECAQTNFQNLFYQFVKHFAKRNRFQQSGNQHLKRATSNPFKNNLQNLHTNVLVIASHLLGRFFSPKKNRLSPNFQIRWAAKLPSPKRNMYRRPGELCWCHFEGINSTLGVKARLSAK